MKYRPHCGGGLGASLARMVNVEGRAGLLAYLRDTEAYRKLDPNNRNVMLSELITDDDMRIEPYCRADDRIGWKDVHIVIITGWGPIGYCEGPAA